MENSADGIKCSDCVQVAANATSTAHLLVTAVLTQYGSVCNYGHMLIHVPTYTITIFIVRCLGDRYTYIPW